MENQNLNQETNTQIATKQAEEVWQQLKEQPMSLAELDKIIPMNTEFFNGLIGVINKQIESDDNSYSKYVSLMQASQTIITDALKDDRISAEERIAILNVLAELNRSLTEVVKIDRTESGKTKRVLALVTGAFATIAAVFIVKDRF